jgi:predicted TIM-barrel fold metal-dependent hydrolase
MCALTSRNGARWREKETSSSSERRRRPRARCSAARPEARLAALEDLQPFAKLLLSERPDRCVWGTNWPHPGMTRFMPNDADLLDLLESWLPDESVRVPLFAANAARLYRLAPRLFH